MPRPTGEDTLHDDFGLAIKATLEADVTGRLSGIIGTGSNRPHVEYGDRFNESTKGKYGRCLVRPLPERQVPAENHEGSSLVEFPFEVSFDAVDARGVTMAKTKLANAVMANLGDRGENMLANFTDSGENLLPGLPLVKIDANTDETQLDLDPDRPKIVSFVTVTAWAKNARTSFNDLP